MQLTLVKLIKVTKVHQWKKKSHIKSSEKLAIQWNKSTYEWYSFSSSVLTSGFSSLVVTCSILAIPSFSGAAGPFPLPIFDLQSTIWPSCLAWWTWSSDQSHGPKFLLTRWWAKYSHSLSADCLWIVCKLSANYQTDLEVNLPAQLPSPQPSCNAHKPSSASSDSPLMSLRGLSPFPSLTLLYCLIPFVFNYQLHWSSSPLPSLAFPLQNWQGLVYSQDTASQIRQGLTNATKIVERESEWRLRDVTVTRMSSFSN